MQRKPWMMTLCALMLLAMATAPVFALERMTNSMIDKAVQYGLENQEMGKSLFLGGNWREGADGALLNIYTPYIELALSASQRDMPVSGDPRNVAETRKKIVEDIHYLWQHPTIKFHVSLLGDDPYFAGKYYASIEGVGQGRHVLLQPSTSVRDPKADKEPGATIKPYSALNSYYFRYEDIAGLDEFVLKLQGKDLEPIQFKLYTKDFQ